MGALTFILIIVVIMVLLLVCGNSQTAVVGGGRKRVHWPEDTALKVVKIFDINDTPNSIGE